MTGNELGQLIKRIHLGKKYISKHPSNLRARKLYESLVSTARLEMRKFIKAVKCKPDKELGSFLVEALLENLRRGED